MSRWTESYLIGRWGDKSGKTNENRTMEKGGGKKWGIKGKKKGGTASPSSPSIF